MPKDNRKKLVTDAQRGAAISGFARNAAKFAKEDVEEEEEPEEPEDAPEEKEDDGEEHENPFADVIKAQDALRALTGNYKEKQGTQLAKAHDALRGVL